MEHTTKVVNIRFDQYDVYIGRAGKGQDGYFGNPFKKEYWMTPGSMVNKFRNYFNKRIKNDPEFKRRVETELLNKRLGCFCVQKEINIIEIPGIKSKPIQQKPCHGHVYIEYFNNLNNDK